MDHLKFLIVGYGYEYYKKVFAQVEQLDNVEYCYNVEFDIPERIFARFCLSKKINAFIPKFLKKFLSHIYISKINPYLKKLNVSKNDKLYIIFLSGGYNNSLIKFGIIDELRNIYSNCKIIYYCSDLVGATNKPINDIKDVSDLVISYDRVDAEQYGMKHYFIPYSDVKYTFSFKADIISDICFVGAAKNRLEDIYSTFDYLTKNGCSCDFYLIGVPIEKRRIEKGLHFVNHISYEENLKILSASNCMLEIIQHDSSGNTLRTNEAIIFDKKLLSNNSYLLTNQLFCKDYMHVFKCPEDIDINFVKKREKVEYQNKEDLFPDKFLYKISQWLR